MKKQLQILSSAIFLLLTAIAAKAQVIPLDPAVRTGKLPNGFTYYIRHNDEPKKIAELYLVNKAGSILEDDDQQGLAHFMEHMNFNGTLNYPHNSLVDYLQKIGVAFGADLNAYTSFDETVYQLPIPVSDPQIFTNGLKIMRDWAQDATLDSVEIDKERGVILEEERLGKGAQDRLQRQYLPLLLSHSRYANRIPIGKDSILTSFHPAAIRRFLKDWYRPDLQALVVVGDIDVNQTEKAVRALFSTLKNPDRERQRPDFEVPIVKGKHFLSLTDREVTATSLSMMYMHAAKPIKTEQDYFTNIEISIVNQLLNNRRIDISSKEIDPAYLSRSTGIKPFFKGINVFGVDITAKDGRLKEAFEQTWTIVEQARRFGFTNAELERVKRDYLAALDVQINERDKTNSVSFVKEYQDLFLNGNPSPGIDWENKFIREQLPNITVDKLDAILKYYLDPSAINILVTGPENNQAKLPDSSAVSGWLSSVDSSVIKPYAYVVNNAPLLQVLPKAGRVVKVEQTPALGLTTYILNNGIRVIMKPTDFKNDEIIFSGFKEGGSSLYGKDKYIAAANATTLVAWMGYGAFTPAELSQKLTGKVATSSLSIRERYQFISGSATPKDLETALQLAYLKFTSPRTDSVQFNKAISNSKAYFQNKNNAPEAVFTDTMNYVMSNYSYRAQPMTVQRIGSVRLDQTMQIYKERFADASGYTFVFVGNFKPQTLRPLVEKYLGSLPSLNRSEASRDNNTYPPKGRIVKKVFMGTENKATVRIFFTGSNQYSQLSNLEAYALGEALQIKILQHLREDESEVYAPQVNISTSKYPKNRYELSIAFGCAPKNVDHLVKKVEEEMKAIREKGPEADDLEKVKAEYLKERELSLKENGFWLSYLLTQLQNHENPAELLTEKNDLDKITVPSLKKAAAIFLAPDNMITFELLPGQAAPDK
jgi:zinc protease